MDKMVEGWRKLHYEELHNLYSSPSMIRMIKIKEDEMDKACSTHGREEECVKDFSGKTRRKKSTGNT
jgi:hypothetical protein